LNKVVNLVAGGVTLRVVGCGQDNGLPLAIK